MFYLFEIAYKYRLKKLTVFADELSEFYYELIQVIAKEPDEAKKFIVNCYVSRNILEFKTLKITPINSPFITNTANISDQIYHQFECIK